MSKWKTTQRRSKKQSGSDSGGSLTQYSYGEPASDSSSLSFLDDMLGTAGAPRSGNNPSKPSSQEADIDDILDLVSGQGSGMARSESGASVISVLSNRGKNKERRDPEPTETSPYEPYTPSKAQSSLRTLHRYGSGGRRSAGSREHSRDPPSRPSSEQTNYRASEERRMSAYDDDDFDDDNATPIPVFQVNTDDDDTISCITTSVTSHCGVDSKSGSFPWSSRRSQKTASIEETSYADTLDEIADMLHPNQNGRSNTLGPRAGHSKSPGRGQTDDFFRPPAKVKPMSQMDDVFGSNKGSPPYGPTDAPSLNADEIYMSSKNTPRRSQHGSSMLACCEPFLSQTRLLIRYWISLIFPREWWKKGGKQEKGQGHLGTWNSSSDPKKMPRSKQRLQLWKSVLFSVAGFFCVMTLVIVLVRLAILHGPKLKSTTLGRIRGGGKKNNDKIAAGKAVYGGMSKRKVADAVVGNAGGAIAGGMAHHSLEEVNALPQKQDYAHHEHLGVELPSAFNTLADVTDLPVRKGVDTPFYWHIPRAGGGTVNDIFGGCLSLTLASDAGGSGAAGKENKLSIIKFSKHFSYVNVDTSTPAGIERAKRLDLVGSGLADLAVSSILYQASSLFSEQHKGRLFTIIRHPVERAISLFHYVQDTQWRRRQTFQKELSDLAIDEYFESGLAENNWMTRFLINEPTKGELTRDDVNLAKEILRRKCLVGLLGDKGESFARFERYFGFPLKNNEQKDCHEKKLQWAWPQKHRHDEVEENTPLWDLILTHNVYDMELYHYASEVLFVEQAEMFK